MPKIKIFLVILSGCSIISLSACVKKEIKNINSSGENIICFGDSITFGYGVNPKEDYPTVLSKMTSMPVINAGVDGDTSISAFKRIEKDVLDKKPFLVVIEFCGNDFLKDIPQESTVNNIREMILRIQKQGAITAVVDVGAGFFMRDYRMKFSRLAKETGSIFIPEVLSGIITNPSMKSDFMHPNKEGYKIVAERIHRAIARYLKTK
jgi:lysophospholipase L1-like esterase